LFTYTSLDYYNQGKILKCADKNKYIFVTNSFQAIQIGSKIYFIKATNDKAYVVPSTFCVLYTKKNQKINFNRGVFLY